MSEGNIEETLGNKNGLEMLYLQAVACYHF